MVTTALTWTHPEETFQIEITKSYGMNVMAPVGTEVQVVQLPVWRSGDSRGRSQL